MVSDHTSLGILYIIYINAIDPKNSNLIGRFLCIICPKTFIRRYAIYRSNSIIPDNGKVSGRNDSLIGIEKMPIPVS